MGIILENEAEYFGMKDEIEALRRERDELKDQITEVPTIMRKLAASQAREQQLREALQYIEDNTNMLLQRVATEALALPQDTTALNAWGAKLLKKWMGHITASGCTSALTGMAREADELEAEK